ncbi:MAG: DUF1329 domain-containing protein [bacterium]
MRRTARTLLTTLTGAMLLVAQGAAHAGMTVESKIKGPPPMIGGEIQYTIDKNNVDQYKDKMPAGMYEQIKAWNHVVNVYETVRDHKFPPQYVAATEKHKGQPKVNEKGGLESYTAGLPFPEPKTGIEVMYNYNYKYNGDDFFFGDTDFYCYSSTGKFRKLVGGYSRIAYQGRLFLDPIPEIETAEGVESKEAQYLNYPEDVAGLCLITVRYQDPSKGDDGWMYIPSIRRVRRISVAQRADSFGGTDLTWDDYRGFSGKVSDYEWKLVGQQEVIALYHAVTWKFRHKAGLPYAEDLRYELRPVWVVEGVNKDKDYLYSKRRLYIDVDSYFILSEDFFDKRGTLWKYLEIPWTPDPRNFNQFAYGYFMYDLLARRSTVIKISEDPEQPTQVMNVGLTEEMFSPSYIQTYGR